MILTYYQAVELMSTLPSLLSIAESANSEATPASSEPRDSNPDKAAIVEMWGYTSPLLEVNGADFY